jgi:hypothetical protein
MEFVTGPRLIAKAMAASSPASRILGTWPRTATPTRTQWLNRSKDVGRAIIPGEVGRREAWPTPPYHCPLELKRSKAGKQSGNA